MPKLYRIVNDTFGKYRVEARGVEPRTDWIPVKDHTDFSTYADARQAVRNLAIRDDHMRNFAPGQWVFTEAQAMGEHIKQPNRVDL